MKIIYSFILSATVILVCSGMSSPLDDEQSPPIINKTNPQNNSASAKPHAGIELDYQSPEKLQLGDSLQLTLTFKVRTQAEQLQLKVRTGEVLLLESDAQYTFDTSVSKKNSVTILVTALKDGATRINLSATILVAGKYQSRSFSIPVIVGDPSQSKSAVTGVVISRPGYTVDKEQGVVSMPAVETPK